MRRPTLKQLRQSNLDADVCRDIVRELIEEQGPLTINQLAHRLRRVFNINSAYLAMTLCVKSGGFTIDNGKVYIQHRNAHITRRGK